MDEIEGRLRARAGNPPSGTALPSPATPAVARPSSTAPAPPATPAGTPPPTAPEVPLSDARIEALVRRFRT